jgi:integrase
VTVHFDPSRPAQPWTVRWREAGRHRRRRFTSEHRLAPLRRRIQAPRPPRWATWLPRGSPAWPRASRPGSCRPKTVNNALTLLSVALGEAQRRGLLAVNPCARVRQLPVHDVEKDYLRLAEIGRYLDGCSAHNRPLAEFLIATGARISEALDVRWRDIDGEVRAIRIYRQRDRTASGSARTKGRRFRSVAIGPSLIDRLRNLREQSPAAQADDFLFLCAPVRRGR